MSQAARLTTEEYVGLGVALVLHVALAAALILRDEDKPLRTPPERIEVSLATEVSLESTAPDPTAEPAAASAPVQDQRISEETVEEPLVTPPVEQPVRPPVAQPSARPSPQPTARPTTRPSPRATPTTRPSARPSAQPTARPSSRPSAAPSARPSAAPTRPATAPRVDENFLNGVNSNNPSAGTPAATFGTTERAALASAITRALRPNWTAPSGVDADQLVTVVSWRLNRDGTLNGQPRCIDQRGINDSNRPQAQLHCERAIRAVQLANFSSLPEQFYSRWDDLEWEFDRRL